LKRKKLLKAEHLARNKMKDNSFQTKKPEFSFHFISSKNKTKTPEFKRKYCSNIK
jgi:hypothetical protein